VLSSFPWKLEEICIFIFISYMTWLTHIKAANTELQRALLANGLVNLRGADDGWFEMDRLN
jgi:hypothetical protein